MLYLQKSYCGDANLPINAYLCAEVVAVRMVCKPLFAGSAGKNGII